jgi:DNA-binding MarR family transcriptional regulator
MATVRDVKEQVDEIKAVLRRMVSTRRLRDPLHDLHPELTPPQVHVLAALSLESEDGMPTSALAHRIVASGPTMTGLIDRLEKQGFVTRERDGDDRRLVKVKLTDAGRAVLVVVEDHVTERLTEVLSVLPPEDRETFARLLTRIIDAFPADKDKG